MTQLITAVGILVMMLRISKLLTLIAVIMVPLSLLVSMGIITASGRNFKKQQEKLGSLNGFIEEMYNGQYVIQAFNYSGRAKAEFEQINEELCESARSAETFSGIISPITSLVNNFGYMLSAAIGCMFAISGKLTIGNVRSMLQYIRNFSQPFTSIAGMAGNLGAAMAAGQIVAIVGPTGAGKTTLINLLMRFYEINSGTITVDGVDTREMTRKELRSRFGMVLQDTWLFEGTIEENLAYSKDGLTHEQLVEAARSAQADGFIRTLPDSYNMVLSKGSENISQGEKQLLTIARAIVSDPEIMILDEATSNVDTHTELIIQTAMARLMKGRTSFVIAHRLSMIRDADMIL